MKHRIKLSVIISLIVTMAATTTLTTLHANSQLQEEIKTLKQTSRAFNYVAEAAIPAVVSISTIKTVRQPAFMNPFFEFFGTDPFRNSPMQEQEFKQKGLGSGVIVSKDGYILTNNHVIESVDEITITLSDNREFSAKVIGTDAKTDLALLKIDGKDLPVIPFGNSDKIEVGDWAIAVGSPFGLKGTVTVGVISSKARSDVDIVDYTDMIQTDAAINPGNSGGALLNIDGELIGINTAIYSRSGGYMGIGFSIPVNMAQRVMEDLIKHGKVTRGWLGVYIQQITEALRRELGLQTSLGALISDVIPESPAARAGLERGDVITAFDGQRITDFKTLQIQIAKTPVNKKVEIEFLRNNKKRTTQITIEAPPQEQAVSAVTETPYGIEVADITPSLARDYRLDSKTGVVITSVAPGSPAEQSGLKEGDVILELNRRRIISIKDYEQVVEETSNRSRALFVIRRKGFTQFVIIETK